MIDSTSTAKPEAKNLGSHEEEDARILYVAISFTMLLVYFWENFCEYKIACSVRIIVL